MTEVTVAEEFSITVVETRVWTWTSGEEVGVVVGDFAVSEDEDDDVVTVEVGEVVEGVVCSADDVDVDVEDVEVIWGRAEVEDVISEVDDGSEEVEALVELVFAVVLDLVSVSEDDVTDELASSEEEADELTWTLACAKTWYALVPPQVSEGKPGQFIEHCEESVESVGSSLPQKHSLPFVMAK
jgi:hypothetical protein